MLSLTASTILGTTSPSNHWILYFPSSKYHPKSVGTYVVGSALVAFCQMLVMKLHRLIFCIKTLEHGSIIVESIFFSCCWLISPSVLFYGLYFARNISKRAGSLDVSFDFTYIWQTTDSIVHVTSSVTYSNCPRFTNASCTLEFFSSSFSGLP